MKDRGLCTTFVYKWRLLHKEQNLSKKYLYLDGYWVYILYKLYSVYTYTTHHNLISISTIIATKLMKT